MLVRADRDGISVGAGLYPVRYAEELLRHDLVRRATGPSGRASFRISAAGQAHLRRQTADAADESIHLAQHRTLTKARIDQDGERVRVRKNDAESPLDWLSRRKDRQGEALVDAAGHQAGERLRRDLSIAPATYNEECR